MDDRALADLEHANMIRSMSLVAGRAPGALITRQGGVALLATGLPLRLFNQVLVADEDADPGAIAEAVDVLRSRGDRFVVNLRTGTDDRFLPLAGELGLVPLGDNPWMPGMAIWPLPVGGQPVTPAGHEIRRVSDARGIDDHRRTAAEGFEMPLAWLEAVMTDDLGEHPDVAIYVGYTDGLPVTAGLGVRTGRTMGIYNIATIPTARRQGLGAAMTMRIVDDAAGEGCDVAILQASDMGKPIYERLGFRTVVEYGGYIDPATTTGG